MIRPAYLKISEIRELLPTIPIGTDSNSHSEVVTDIQTKLNFKKTAAFSSMSFERKNLAYIVRLQKIKQEELLHIFKQRVRKRHCIHRNRNVPVKFFTGQQRNNCHFYHAGLNNDVKDQRLTGESRTMVATNAFGMGIDKPDVRPLSM